MVEEYDESDTENRREELFELAEQLEERGFTIGEIADGFRLAADTVREETFIFNIHYPTSFIAAEVLASRYEEMITDDLYYDIRSVFEEYRDDN
mgnify:CR=1 FL=1